MPSVENRRAASRASDAHATALVTPRPRRAEAPATPDRRSRPPRQRDAAHRRPDADIPIRPASIRHARSRRWRRSRPSAAASASQSRQRKPVKRQTSRQNDRQHEANFRHQSELRLVQHRRQHVAPSWLRRTAARSSTPPAAKARSRPDTTAMARPIQATRRICVRNGLARGLLRTQSRLRHHGPENQGSGRHRRGSEVYRANRRSRDRRSPPRTSPSVCLAYWPT